MKKALLILALAGAAHAAAAPLPAAPKVVTDDGYVLTDGWNCPTPTALRDAVESGGRAAIEKGCVPVLGARRTNLVAVMGDVAFVCDRVREDLGGGYACTYAATKFLRANGKPVPEREWSVFDRAS